MAQRATLAVFANVVYGTPAAREVELWRVAKEGRQLRKVADGLRGRFAQAAALLADAAEDILAYRHLPIEHQRQLHSTNPLSFSPAPWR